MFIQTQDTPNPATLKFLPGRDVVPGEPVDLPDASSAQAKSPLAAALFALPGVARVFLGADFVAVTKTDAMEWSHLKPLALAAIMDHFTAGVPVLTEAAAAPAESAAPVDADPETAEIVAEIQDLIAQRVRPAVAADGGDIVFHRFEKDTGRVFLSMRGACAGCPSSTATLKMGIENLLKHYVPEVTSVEAAEA